MDYSGLKWVLSCGMQTDRPIFQSAFMRIYADAKNGLLVYVNQRIYIPANQYTDKYPNHPTDISANTRRNTPANPLTDKCIRMETAT